MRLKLSCKVLEPLHFPVVDNGPRYLPHFVQASTGIDSPHWPGKMECPQVCKRNCKEPHHNYDGIAVEKGISSAGEHSVYYYRVEGSSDYVDGKNKGNLLEIFDGLRCKGDSKGSERNREKDQEGCEDTAEKGKDGETEAIDSRSLQVSASKLVADNDGGSSCKASSEAKGQVPHHLGKGIGCSCIFSHVAQEGSVGRNSDGPY